MFRWVEKGELNFAFSMEKCVDTVMRFTVRCIGPSDVKRKNERMTRLADFRDAMKCRWGVTV